jgi:transposase
MAGALTRHLSQGQIEVYSAGSQPAEQIYPEATRAIARLCADMRRRLTSELTVSYHSQQNDLPEIKTQLREEFQEIAAHVLQDVLRRLDWAFQAFFRRVRNGETPGYPRFKARDRYDSFTYPDHASWNSSRRSPSPTRMWVSTWA